MPARSAPRPPRPDRGTAVRGLGGAIYVPSVIDGDSVWLMLDTGLSRTGLDRDWASTIGIVAAGDTASTTLVPTLRLGQIELPRYRVALYRLRGLSEASGRLQRGLLGHDVLQRFALEI